MFFQVDDKLHANPKVNAMLDELGFIKAGPAMLLWTLAGSWCRDAPADGVVTAALLGRLTGNRPQAEKAAALLVKYRLWHTQGHDCPKCPDVPAGSFVFHDWFQFGYGTAEAEKVAVEKRKELRDRGVVEAVWARDTAADGRTLCRYCARPVVRPKHGGNRKTDLLGQLDHVDPTIANGAANIAVACSECNRAKSQRTPEQAGMTLLPAPTPVENQFQVHGSRTAEVPPAGARADAGEAGSGEGVGVGTEVGPGQAAGQAPVIPVPARYGSPWRDHSGPPPDPDLIAEATCPDHGLPTPCHRCMSQAPAYRPDPPPIDAPPVPAPGRPGPGGRSARKAS